MSQSTSSKQSASVTSNCESSGLTPWTATYRAATFKVTVQDNPWIRNQPTPKQTAFLLAGDAAEILFGGAAGPGKSTGLLMAGLQYVDVPSYAAIIFRRSFSMLALPGGLIPKSHEWLSGTAARWDEQQKLWRFPSGAVLAFGYLDAGNDRYRYQSSEFQYIAFDELTEFQEQDYLFLFSRLRRLSGSQVPLRVRAASNPGGPGHAWVKRRFIGPNAGKDGRLYMPARLTDNPHLDREQYRKSLQQLPAFVRKQLEEGDWSEYSGNVFHPGDWPRWTDAGDAFILQAKTGTRTRHVRKADVAIFCTVDPATSSKTTADYTAILTLGILPGGGLLVLDAFRERIEAGTVVDAIGRVCRTWRPGFIALETIGFSKLLYDEASRRPEIPPVREVHPQGKGKLHRAYPAVIKAERGELYLPAHDAAWLDDLETELASFTGVNDDHDDLTDCLAYAVLTAPQSTGDDTDAIVFAGPGYGMADHAQLAGPAWEAAYGTARTWTDDRTGRPRFTGGYDDPYDF